MIRMLMVVLLLVLSAPAVWGQCGPGQQLRPIGGGRFSCANTDRVPVKDALGNLSIGTTLLGLDISTPANPSAGYTKFYAKAGKWCALSPDGVETCTGEGGSGAGNVTGPTGAALGAVLVSDTTGLQLSESGCTAADGELTCPGGFSAGDGTAAGFVDLPETAANGEDKITIAAPASITARYTLTLPAGQPNGQVLQFAAPVAGVSAGSWVAAGSGGGGIPPREYIAAKCANGTAGPGLQLPVNNSPTPACAAGTNTTYGVLQFPDSDGVFSIQDNFEFPGGSVINFSLKWRSSATTGDVVWQLQTVCVADGEAGDPAWNAAQTVADTAKGTTLQWNNAGIAGVTTAGCAAGEQFFFRLLRDRTHASDTIAGVVELLQIRFTFE